MIKVALVRGAYLNQFEGQNYIFNPKRIRLTGVSSLFPIHQKLPFKIIRLLSLADIPLYKRSIRFIANRTIGDSQILFGLESLADKFDIFHTADPHYYYSYQLAQLRKQGKIKSLISTSWETIPFNNESTQAKKRIKYFTQSQVDLFICYTEMARQALIMEGVSAKKIKVIPLGIDLKRFTTKTKEDHSPYVNLLFVGRLVQEKGVLEAYKAFKQNKYKRSLFKIVGEGPIKNVLKHLIQKDKLQSRVTIEPCSYENIPDLYKEADIVILPSKKTRTWEEQYGMVFIEAMASGVPILTYNTGAISEVVGEACLYATTNNISSLSSKLKTLITNKQLRTKLGTIGKERAIKRYDSVKLRIQSKTYMKLSTVILAKNEEKNIKKALESVRFSDEIIIIDTGSTDKTLDIVKELNAKIIQTPFENDFSKLRNKGFSEAQGGWVLFIDSDEEITQELKKEIIKILHSANKEINAYYLKRRDFMWGRELRFGETKKVRTQGLIRLVRRQKGEWKGMVHETFIPVGLVSHLQGYINHYPHKTLSDFLTNINTYSAIRAQEVIQSGRKVTIIELMTVPFFKFIYTYVLLMGFRDGALGFIYAFLMSFHSFLVRAKVYVYHWKKESSH